MSGINLDELVAQRADATGVDGDRIPFTFADKQWTFRDPLLLSDDEKDELADLGDYDPDVASWYMGDDQYDKFLAAGGSSSLFLLAFREHMMRVQEATAEGKPTASNRASRRRRRR